MNKVKSSGRRDKKFKNGLRIELNEDGVTIIKVTHPEKNASYGSRTIHLLDGRNTNN